MFKQTWLPIPWVSDNFVRASLGNTNGLGHPEANGGGGVAWTGTGAAISSNTLVVTPTLGSELNSGSLVVGTWYSITATQTNHFYSGSAIGDTFRATATTGLDSNNKVKALTLATQIASVPVPTSDVWIDIAVPTFTLKTQFGVIAHLDSQSTPAAFIIFYFDGAGNLKIDELSSGTWVNKSTVVKVWTTGDRLMFQIIGTQVRVYHLPVGGVQVAIASYTTTITGGGYAGVFSTSSGNAASSFVVWDEDTQYQYLERFVQTLPGEEL